MDPTFKKSRDEVAKIIAQLIQKTGAAPAVTMSVEGASKQWPTDFDTDCEFRALIALSARTVNQSDVMRVLSRMADQSERTVDDFERIFQDVCDSRSIAESVADWSFLLPFNIRISNHTEPLPVFDVMGTRFWIESWNVATASLDASSLEQAIRGLRMLGAYPSDSEFCLVCKASGSSWEGAWQRIVPGFDAFRSVVEFTLGIGKQHWSNPPKPSRRVPHPLAGFAIREGSDQCDWFYFHVQGLGARPESPPEIKQDHLATVAQNLTDWIGKPEQSSDIRNLIADVLRLYSQALDCWEPHASFLGMWQCAEALTMANEKQSGTERTCNRLVAALSAFGASPLGIRNALGDLALKRNTVAHHGIHEDVTQDDRNFLKMVCDMVLFWLIKMRSQIPTRGHLDRFFELHTRTDAQLNAYDDVIHLIRESRKKSRAEETDKGKRD